MNSFLQFLKMDAITATTSTSSLLIPISLAILSCFTLTLSLKWLLKTKKPMPPSPPKLPIIGNLHQVGLHPHRSLQSLSQIYGPIMLLHLGNTRVLIISSPNAAIEILKNHDLVFANRPYLRVPYKIMYNYRDVSTAPYGEYWRQMKSISVLNLLSNKRVRSYSKIREEETCLMIEKVKNKGGDIVNLSELFALLTNDVACRVALGRKYSENEEEGLRFKKLMGEFVEVLEGFDVGDYFPWLGWISKVNGTDAKVERVAREIDEFLDSVVKEHESRGGVQGEDNSDFVDILLQMQRERGAGFEIDRVSIKATILDVFAAGTDTTYTVLEWAMAELLKNPETMQKLQKEIRDIANSEPTINEQHLDKLHYLKAVIKETFRLHPPIPLLLPRISSEDVKIQDFEISSGTQVYINVWAIGRDPGTWKHPDKFWPDRFLDSNVDFRGHNFELIPFGAGRRLCPGIQFSMSVDELALANLLYKFDWSLPRDRFGAEDLDMSESSGITVHRKFPLLALASPFLR